MSSTKTARQREIGRLLRLSKELYAERQVGKGYWARERAFLLIRHPQYHTAIIHDLRGTPPVGTIWIRPSTGGKWGKSRREKYGAPDSTLPSRKVVSRDAAASAPLAERLRLYKTARRVLEREHREYAAAAMVPEGRIVFDAEGGFRVENN